MLQPGRSYTNGNQYRYGFNGKEKDDDVKGEGAQYDYGFRIYDPRIGRFLSVDPLTKDYPWLTPYQYASNKPIWKRDIDGLEAEGEKDAEIAPRPQPQSYRLQATYRPNLRNSYQNRSMFIPSSQYNTGAARRTPAPIYNPSEGEENVIGPFVTRGNVEGAKAVAWTKALENLTGDKREEYVNALISGHVESFETSEDHWANDQGMTVGQTKLVSITFKTVEAQQAFQTMEADWTKRRSDILRNTEGTPLDAPYYEEKKCIMCVPQKIEQSKVTQAMKDKRIQDNLTKGFSRMVQLQSLGKSPSQLILQDIMNNSKNYKTTTSTVNIPEIRAAN